MSKMRTTEAAGVMFVAALSLSVLLLSGCDERPYPSAANSYVAPPNSPPPHELAGAPSPPPQAYAPPPPRPYDPPAIVAMAPIPNPGDPGSDGYYSGRGHGHRVHTRLYTSPPHALPPAYAGALKAPVYASRPAPRPFAPPPAYAKASTPPPVKRGYAGALTPPGPVKPYAPPKDYRPEPPPGYAAVQPNPAGYARKSADVAAATATVVAGVGKHISTIANGAAGQAKAAYNANKAAAAPPALAAVPAPPPASRLDRSTRLSALQSSLTDAISKGAALTAPQRFTANQPADVSLTIPAAFADTLRNEAQKNGLSDAAASVNMNVVLSGDGFSVTPDETQSLPLTVGQPTEFRWTVTAQPGAKGPLHADVGADLLGGGSDTLALGSVQKQAGFGVKPTPRMVGAAILVLILALVVVWLARGRGPSRPASARRASRAARGARPLDMGATEG